MTDEQRAEIQRLHSLGLGPKEISRRVGVSRTMVGLLCNPVRRTRQIASASASYKNHGHNAQVPGWHLLTPDERRAVNELCERLFPQTVCDMIGE